MRNLLPGETWALIQQQPDALFVDVRMEIESMYVGRPPGVVNIPWYEYPVLTPDIPRFVSAIEREAGGTTRTVILICRTGQRTWTPASHWRPRALRMWSTCSTASRATWTTTSTAPPRMDGAIADYPGSRCRNVAP
jgi:rhodanese-related sulfurtransferase